MGGGMKQRSIADARHSLPTLVREAESGKAVELTRRGQPVAVLIGRREYQRLTSSHRGFSEAYAEFTREIDLEGLAIDPDEVFGGVRDRSRARVVRL
jgi:prevent-host-death family protein